MLSGIHVALAHGAPDSPTSAILHADIAEATHGHGHAHEGDDDHAHDAGAESGPGHVHGSKLSDHAHDTACFRMTTSTARSLKLAMLTPPQWAGAPAALHYGIERPPRADRA